MIDSELVTRKLALILQDLPALIDLARKSPVEYLNNPIHQVLTERYSPALLMNASAAIVDSPLRQASRRACSPLSPSADCFKYASVPRGCACPSRLATSRFRDEPS